MNKFKKYLQVASLCCVLILFSGFWLSTPALLSTHLEQVDLSGQYLARTGSRGDNWPVALILDTKSGNGVTISRGVSSPVSVSGGESIGYNERLNIHAGTSNGANLRFQTANNFDPGYLAAAGGHPTRSSKYFFPCGAEDRFVIGWRSGSKRGCDPVSFRPGGAETPIGPAASHQTQTIVAESLLNKQSIDPWVSRVNLRHYCSAIADSGDQWGVSLSEKSWSEEEVVEVCQKALETCESAGDQACFIAHQGDWRRHHPKQQFRNVDLLLQCEQNREYHSKVSDLEVVEGWQQLQQKAQGDQASACVLYMYYFDEVLISPTTEQKTLIYTDSSDSGFVINDIIGSTEITITSPSEPDLRKVSLQPGERYVADYQTGTVQVEPIPPEDRLAISDSSTVRSFLDENQWDDSVKADIRAYGTDFNELFLPKPPAIAVETRTVRGISVVVAEVDLNNPNTILSVSREEDVRNAGGLTSFASNKNAALVLSGTFEDAANSNWTTISEGRFLEGERSKNWSNYTVLGLKRGNQPEMLARRNQPAWDDYWFALTGHPRLVSGGIPGVTEVAQGSSLNINGRAGRAGIGFSRYSNKLFHVITNDSVSLPDMAEIMKDVGCDEAMNLEGGGGYFIVRDNEVYGPGSVRSPVIVVNDAQNLPTTSIQQAWQNF